MNDCLFCKIVRNEIKSFKVYEDELVIGFLDAFPRHYGHTLIIPKKHSNNYLEASDEDIKAIALAAKKVGNAVEKATKCDGIFLRTNINAAAQQVIFHSHMHIVPQYKDNELDPVASDELAKKIASFL